MTNLLLINRLDSESSLDNRFWSYVLNPGLRLGIYLCQDHWIPKCRVKDPFVVSPWRGCFTQHIRSNPLLTIYEINTRPVP